MTVRYILFPREGINKTQIAKQLDCTRPTVYKLVEMTTWCFSITGLPVKASLGKGF
ncbi:MAG: helix-turn-helix domain-containing protein [Colwellia sp.]|nr:helix-turn-helix domain-containing protein [Colwellia sp.]